MKKQIFILALWMFFGFVLINAIDSILKFLVNIYFNFGLWREWSVDFLIYSIPALSVLLYLITSIFAIKFLQSKSENFQPENARFSKVIFVISIIIAIFLTPIRHELSGLVIAEVFSREPDVYENFEFINIYGITSASLEICSWLTIIILSIYFYRTYKKNRN